MAFYAENNSGIEPEIPWVDLFKRVAAEVLKTEGCPFEAAVNLTLVTPDEIKERNEEFREIDRVTDVLSFPLVLFFEPGNFSDIVEGDPDSFDPDTGELILGDILLCYERATEQAEEYGHSIEREFSFLIAHSMLHLLGFDHESDEDRLIMEEKQERVLEALSITRDYIS